MAIRIWHQSLTELGKLPGYRAQLAAHAAKVCGPDVTVELHGMRPGTYPEGMPPVAMVRYAWAERLADLQIVENIAQAERDGFDAVAISCFLDPGLELGRSLVDIPVVSSCETAFLVAQTMGRAFGVITLDDVMVEAVGRLVTLYGCEGRVTEVVPLDPPLDEFELDRAFAGSPEFVERFARQARALVAGGADVIVPAEGVLNTVLVRNGVREVDGTPVLDSYGALLGLAEMLVNLRRRTGFATGRAGAYARPPEALVDHLRSLTAGILGAPRRR